MNANVQQAVRNRWQALNARERRGVALALTVLGCAIVWWALVAPALRTLRQAPEQHLALQAQLAQMQGLQAQARTMQARAALDPATATAHLQAAASRLGPNTRVVVQGDQVTLNIQGASASAMTEWMLQLQSAEALQPTQLRLQRSGTAPNVTWSGTVLFQLPGAPAR